MNTGYQQTSMLAYIEAMEGLNQKQTKVFEVIERLRTCNDRQIAKELGWEINRVTPRRKELTELNKVKEAARMTDPETNRTVIYWKITV